jgi:iduronate 2-sulfatase
MMPRRLAVVVCAALLAGSMAGGAEPPNVLFLMADDLRCDLACYGHPLMNTPNLDRLAARGTLFHRAYCQQALCNPSRASMLTGRRPDTLEVWNLATHFRDRAPDVVTLPQHFKQHGYRTRGIGKIFHNWHTQVQGDPMSWSVPAVMHYAQHGTDLPQVKGELPANHTSEPKTQCLDVPDEAYFDGRIAELAVRALGELADRPFFLAVGFWKPHLPFNPPKRYWDLYQRLHVTLPANPGPPQGVPPLALHNSRELLSDKGRELSADDVRELRHGYYAGISYLDAQVGKVLDELDRLGLAANTIVVFCSDHGFHLGEHGLWCKTSNFELDARVPLVIAAPQRQAGGTTQALAELLDLYPTLVELCGLAQPEGLEGTSLAPVLANAKQTVKPAAFTQHPRPAYYQQQPEAMGCSVRTDRVRYTEWRDWQTGRVVARELYDHAADPHETRNVIEAPPDAQALESAISLLRKQFPLRGD